MCSLYKLFVPAYFSAPMLVNVFFLSSLFFFLRLNDMQIQYVVINCRNLAVKRDLVQYTLSLIACTLFLERTGITATMFISSLGIVVFPHALPECVRLNVYAEI